MHHGGCDRCEQNCAHSRAFRIEHTAPRKPSELETTVQSVTGSQYSSLVDGESDEQKHRRQLLSALRILADFWGATDELRAKLGCEFDEFWRSPDQLATQLCALKPTEIAESLPAELRMKPGMDPLTTISEEELRQCNDKEPHATAKLLK